MILSARRWTGRMDLLLRGQYGLDLQDTTSLGCTRLFGPTTWRFRGKGLLFSQLLWKRIPMSRTRPKTGDGSSRTIDRPREADGLVIRSQG